MKKIVRLLLILAGLASPAFANLTMLSSKPSHKTEAKPKKTVKPEPKPSPLPTSLTPLPTKK